MDPDDLARRAEVARRLKAARWLTGTVEDDPKTGRPKVAALSPDQLARRGDMAANQITASRIGSIERMERHTPPMELDVIADALGLPNWFAGSTPAELRASRALDALEQALADLGLATQPSAGATPSDADASDRPLGDGEGDGG